MLPLCHSITLRERAKTNREWLLQQRQAYAKSWDSFWHALENHAPLYKTVEDPRSAVHSARRGRGRQHLRLAERDI
jgi:hypothetical protein